MLYERPPSNVTEPNSQESTADEDRANGDQASEDQRGRTLLRQLVQWFLPCPCLGCGDTVWQPRHALGLCPACRSRLCRWPAGCRACGQWRSKDRDRFADGRRSTDDGRLCSDCLLQPPPHELVLSSWSYQPPLDEVMTGLKFRRLDYLGEHLGKALAEVHQRELPDIDLVLPVPLPWTRRLTRGYNQAALIARPLARRLGLDYAEPLTRKRSTPQSRLGRDQRLHNLDRTFVARRRARVVGKSLLLIDDVLTTGATVRAAASCLKQAGARSVVVLTAARTPTDSQRNQLLKR